jgi:hypothetical protein
VSHLSSGRICPPESSVLRFFPLHPAHATKSSSEATSLRTVRPWPDCHSGGPAGCAATGPNTDSGTPPIPTSEEGKTVLSQTSTLLAGAAAVLAGSCTPT